MGKILNVLIDDGMQIELGTGIGKYSQYLYEHLHAIDRVEVSLTRWNSESASRKSSRLAYLRHINSAEFAETLSRYDIALFTNYAIPYKKMPCKIAVCIPDLVSYRYPETLPKAYRLYNRAMIKNSVKRSDLVMTISRSVADELASQFPDYSGKIEYAWLGLYEGIRSQERFAPYANAEMAAVKKGRFFLFVSTVEKRKNVEMVVRAFFELKEKEKRAAGYKLVLAGRPGFGYDRICDLVRNSDYASDVIFTGYVSDEDINRLYNEASAFVFPTVYEGFGFAQIECMSCNLPIILSDIPTNREISREYGMYFDLKEPESLTRAMRRIVVGDIDKDRLEALAKRYLDDFSWNAVAEKYVEIFTALLSEKSSPS